MKKILPAIVTLAAVGGLGYLAFGKKAMAAPTTGTPSNTTTGSTDKATGSYCPQGYTCDAGGEFGGAQPDRAWYDPRKYLPDGLGGGW